MPKQQKTLLDDEIKKLIKNPTLGERKKGDLDFLRVHKFKFSNQEVLLGYMYEENELILTLLKLGVHENFYRDIKK
ncbi:type II toxin-antitoxin system RelE/ParE family toxin [Legionella pneumophila serogroup 2]